MATIVTRAGKGSPLTHVEVDANFTNLNTAKAELASPALTGNVTVASNSATAAVTITQIGAGNALVVEDSASPDATPFVVTATGNVGIGTSSPAAPLTVSALGNSLDLVTPSGGLRFYVSTTNFATLLGNSTNHPLQIYTNNTERMRIDASGNVGIGTTTTSGYRFAVVGSSASSIPLYLNTDATNAYVYSPNPLYVGSTGAYQVSFVTNNTERMRIDASGNVGIGTSSPNAKLEIANATAPDIRLTVGSTLTTNFYASSSGTNLITVPASPLIFGTSNTERMRIDSSGNVGIGTSSPVNNAGYTTLTISGTSGGVLQLQDGANSRAQLYSTSSGVTLSSLGAIPLFFGTQGIARAAIDSVGNFQFNNGYGSIATAYGCRAWVKFGSAGTISGSGNVSSVTVNATGSFTVNFTTAMPDANYSAVGTAGNGDVAGDEIVSFFPSTRVAAGSLGVRNSSGGGTAVSAAVNFVSVFR